MAVPKIISRVCLPALTGAALAACSSAAPAAQAPVSSTSAAPSSTTASPTTSAPATSKPATTSKAAPSDGSCGTVTAASGLTLQVLDSSAGGVACAQAEQLVGKFQAQIAGRQPAGSNEPVSATVDGWLCVSGPPAAQGGTTCSLGDNTVFARVTTPE